MIDVTMDDLYREACQALGEAIVRERLLAREVARLTAESLPGDYADREGTP